MGHVSGFQAISSDESRIAVCLRIGDVPISAHERALTRTDDVDGSVSPQTKKADVTEHLYIHQIGSEPLIKPVDLLFPASWAPAATAVDPRAEECRAGHQEKASPAAANRAFVEDDDYRS